MNITESQIKRSLTKVRLTSVLNAAIEPTHFVTISLNQSRKICNLYGSTHIIAGDDVIYADTFRSFINSLSKRCHSRQVWKRLKPKVACYGSIEGGSGSQRYHLHLTLRKPQHLSDDEFECLIVETAGGNSWIMNGDFAVKILRLRCRQEQLRTGRYIFKYGVDRFLFEPRDRVASASH